MIEEKNFSLGFSDPESSRNGNDESNSPLPNGVLGDAIGNVLRTQWMNNEPSKKCFDQSYALMRSLSEFIKGRSSDDQAECVRTHLLECSRCRFIYSIIREESEHACESRSKRRSPQEHRFGQRVPELLRANLHSSRPVVFPDGKIATGAWEFGRLEILHAKEKSEIIELVSDQAWRVTKASLPQEKVVIVCFSRPVHSIGKRFARRMVEAGIKDPHVVIADDFFCPKIWCNPKELAGQHVYVFVDVVHSGGLLNRLYSACEEAGPHAITGISIINQSSCQIAERPLHVLWEEEPEERTLYDKDVHGVPRFFDPAAALARPKEELPKELAGPCEARSTVECSLATIEPLIGYIESTNALRRDAKIGGVYYPWAIDLVRLLRNDEAQAALADRVMCKLSDLHARGPWCIVYPAERWQRAGAWARLISKALNWPIVRVGKKARTHYCQLTRTQKRHLGTYPNALIVDAAIRTGKTLQSLTHVLRKNAESPCGKIVAFYAFDGLCNEPRDQLVESLGVELRSLFQLPLGAPTEPVGEQCRLRMSDTLRELETLEGNGPSPWVRIVRSYCKKKLARRRWARDRVRTASPVHQSIKLAFDEGSRGAEVRLKESCQMPRASLVRHLDIKYSLSEPRMRNVLHGFLCNSMPPDFIEWCALALSTQKDFEWFDRDWLALHKRLFTNRASPRWEFLAYLTYRIRTSADECQVVKIRQAIDSFRRSQSKTSPSLFAELFDYEDQADPLDSRCRTLLSVLAADREEVDSDLPLHAS